MASASPGKSLPDSPLDTPEPTSSTDSTVSRENIAKSLGAKDPSWFRQTPDRGIGSAAYRKNQEDDVSEVGSVSGRRQLPGMSRESTAEPEATSPPSDSIRSSSPSRVSSVRGSVAWSNRLSTNTSVSGGDEEPLAKGKSPLPLLESHKFGPPLEHASSVDGADSTMNRRSMVLSPTQGRIAAERPPSPTKGKGGFVQSAMLKRNESVSKRWSAQIPPGLSRQNSTASNRSTVVSGFNAGTTAKPESRPTSLSRETSTEPLSRPGSSSSNLTVTKDGEKFNKGEFVRPALPHHSRSKSVASLGDNSRTQDDATPPSPSKRWSPTKSSWLESALNKPESPKPKAQPPQQPAWMAEINRIKQQRGSIDLGKDSPLGPSAPTVKPSKPSHPTDAVQKPAIAPKVPTLKEDQEKDKLSVTLKSSLSLKPTEPTSGDPTGSSESAAATGLKETTIHSIPSDTRSSQDAHTPSATPKSKPETPPKKDFRAVLRSRQTPVDTPKQEGEVTEFQNVFGKLRKAETKNYVAPDELKGNILRGKASLSTTGGPKPSQRKDEFRESLISKKAAMLAKAQETGSAAQKKLDIPLQKVTPEAIARRNTLSKPSGAISGPEVIKKATPPEPVSQQRALLHKPPSPGESGELAKESTKTSKLAERFNPALAGLLARGPSPMSASPARGGSIETTPAATSEAEPNKGPELTHATKGRARGPKRRAPTTKHSMKEEPSAPSKTISDTSVTLVKAVDVVPSNAHTEVPGSDVRTGSSPMPGTPIRNSVKAKPITPAKSPDLSKKTEKTASPEIPRKPSMIELERKVPSSEHTGKDAGPGAVESRVPKSETPTSTGRAPSRPLPTPTKVDKPVQVSAISNTRSTPTVSTQKGEISSPSAERAPVKAFEQATSWSNPRPLPMPKGTKKQDEVSTASDENRSGSRSTDDSTTGAPEPLVPVFSVKKVTSLWSRQTSSPPPTGPRSPITLPTRAGQQDAPENARFGQSSGSDGPIETSKQEPKPKPIGLGLGFGGFTSKPSRVSSPSKAPSTQSYPASPPASGGRPQSEPFKPSARSPNPDDIFVDFFDEPPVIPRELPKEIDTLNILTSSPIDLGPSSKIRTLRKQIQEITGDGKLSMLPMNEEHVLFSESMYICTHVFEDFKGVKNVEVYLWAGNGVADATLEDAQLFARNIAKHSQGKLIILRQGKETPHFFEALGGIVITRRGSRPASNRYMLCGRRHLGHLAFDEVEYSLNSLCSAFPYLVTAGKNDMFLWTGCGCSAEEVSGARLMGMDLATHGQLIEIKENSEGAKFLDLFAEATSSSSTPQPKKVPRSAHHWHHKANSNNYRSRLFKVEQQYGSLGWGQSLQVSSFLAPLLRRPSWQSIQISSSPEHRPTERPQTPTTPKSPPVVTTKVVEIMPFCQRDLDPEHIYVLDAFFEMYM